MAFDLSKISVLVVDDSRQMRVLLRDILKTLGISTIFEVADGSAAIAMIKMQNVDIIIIDQHMKPVSGIEFLHWLRQSEESPNPYTPVVMITGDSTRAITQAARDAGVSAFVAKPMSVQNFINKLMFVLKDSRKFIKAKTYAGPDRRFRVDNGLAKAGRRGADKKLRVKA